MLSNLPDPILQLILSGLPTTEEVVRTSILSRRWRYLWTLIPSLDIDCTRRLNPSTDFKPNEFKEFVCRVLVDQTLDLESVRLCCANYYDMSTVGRWIHAAVLRKVKLLDLSFCPNAKHDAIELPRSLVTCDSLEVLKLFLNDRSLCLPAAIGFPALRVLQLNSVGLSGDELVKQFFERCPQLEDLSLIDCLLYQLNDLCISSPNLKTLRIDNRKMDCFESSDIDDVYSAMFDNDGVCNGLKISCPKLVYLEYAGHVAQQFSFENLGSLKIAVIYPDDVARIPFPHGGSIRQLFSFVSHVESLSLNLSFIQCISPPDANFPASLPNLKTLEISTTIDNHMMNAVMWILKCSPNLESVHLIIEEEHILPYPNSQIIFWLEPWKVDEELTHHLKRVEFLEFKGEKGKLDMALFFLEHANELEEMVFSWRNKVYYHEMSTKSITMKKVMEFYNGSSSTAKLITLLKE